MNNIKDLIYEIRGKQVMLDSDVAKLYGYDTKRINEVVRRNIKRFPESFCFKLNTDEFNIIKNQIMISKSYNMPNNLRFQYETSNLDSKQGGLRYLPYAFTEQGIAMLSGLLKNDIAIEVSINIMNAFVEMRKFILNNAQIFERLTTVEYKLLEHDNKIDEVFNLLQKEENFKEKIFYEGQIYDAYSLLVDFIIEANSNIVIIDNYINKTILDILTYKKDNVEVLIITKDNNLIDLDISKFNEQYPKLTLCYDNSYHDRFIIIDDVVYHLGASLKDLGKKCFAITKMEDKTLLDKIKIGV